MARGPGGARSGRPPGAPWAVVVAGASGAGKSTIADLIASATGAAVADGDAFHTETAVAKMHSGTPLDDADRLPWLASIGSWLDQRRDAGDDAVISCSALRRSYRDVLASGRDWVDFCLLDVPAELLRRRLANRSGHFMPATLLPSQLATLEPLTIEEHGVTVEASGSPEQVLAAALSQLGLVDDR